MNSTAALPEEDGETAAGEERLATTESIGSVSEPDALDGVLEELEPEELLETIQAVIEQYSGPLPHPSLLQAYQTIDPACVPWILDRASKEQDHRHWCERAPLDQARRGQTFAFVLGILVVFVGALLIYSDKPLAGFTAMFVPLASLLGLFVYREIRSTLRGSPPDGTDTERD